MLKLKAVTVISSALFRCSRMVFISLVIFPFFTSCPASAYGSKYRTIAHHVLELESDLGIRPNDALLDEIIDEARQRIKIKQSYSADEAIKTLKAVDHLLLEKNFLYDGRIRLLSEALKPRRLDKQTIQYIRKSDPNNSGADIRDNATLKRIILASDKHKQHALKHIHENFYFGECKTFSFLYLGIADALGLPVNMVLAPSHVFIRWRLHPGRHVNWETTSGAAVSDDFMRRSFDISENSIRSGVYLKNLSESESMATACYMLGNFLTDADRKITYLTKAVQLNPKHSRAYYNRGTVWYKKRKLHRALADYDQAIALDTKHSETYNNRGNIWYEMRKFDNALADYNQAIALNPKHSRAYNNQGNVWYQMGKWGSAITSYNRAIQSDPTYSGAYNNRGNVWYQMGKFAKALSDYNTAIRLDPDNNEARNNRTNLLKKIEN
ncbi:tetratricopeptide repeat protein [Desulfonema magnum]|uniref:tetratricopeptide repeat protein n=1 Tax=Desulfonema magnum TaxID=45655 RepID=UPI001A9AF498|nr:tetratricopeptide repeat protein [Desulfonema magnum]